MHSAPDIDATDRPGEEREDWNTDDAQDSLPEGTAEGDATNREEDGQAEGAEEDQAKEDPTDPRDPAQKPERRPRLGAREEHVAVGYHLRWEYG